MRKVYRGFVQERALRALSDENAPFRFLIWNEYKEPSRFKVVEVEVRVVGPARSKRRAK